MAKAVLVGEAWGKSEAEFKHPLVGYSGRELSLQLGISGFAPFMTLSCRKCKNRTRFIEPRCEFCNEFIWPNEFTLMDHWKLLRADHGIHVTNVFQTQPPNNDLGYFFDKEPQTPMPGWKASKRLGGSHVTVEYYNTHVKRLWRELELEAPNLIVAMGNAACWALLGQTKITALRGTVNTTNHNLTGLNVKILPTFHPAAVIRQPSMRVSTIADFRKAAREVQYPEIRRPRRWITILDEFEANCSIAAGYDWFQRPARAYANDIETARGQITIVGFARSDDDALVIPLRFKNGAPYWTTPELEFAAWKLIIHGLQTPQPKIFQNGVYDLSYYLRMGIHPRNILHDTMLWHHSEFIELPKSLGFLGSIYANEVAWKQMTRQSSLKRDE